jgi:ankyrin repeat protein
LNVVKHLNSPLFQKIYLPNIGAGPEVSVPGTRTASPEPSQKDDEETDADADAAPSSTNGEPESSGAHLLSATSPIATGTDHAETNGLAVDHGPDEDLAANTDEIPEAQDINEESKPRLTLNTNAEEPMAAADANETGDEVVVLENGSDDSPEENKPKEDQDEVNSVADSDVEENDNRQFAPRSDNVYVYPRYEISQAMYHLQMVEEQWTAEDNRTEEFELLFEDVVRFFHGPGFAAWKEFEVSRPKAPLEGQAAATSLTALHITAANGLVELSRRLLDKQEAEAQANASVERADTTENGAPQDDTEPEFNMGGVADGANSDINARTVSGTTPLWWAASVSGAERRYNICKLLLERGALPGVDALRRADGELVNQEPPFHSLLYNSATEARVVRLFLDNGAKATETDPYGYNALHDFAWVGSDPEILDMLIEAGADINVKDDGGETPLHKLLNGRGTETPLDLLKRFLHHKADITVDDKYGQQALFEVAQSGSVEALKVILSHDPAPEIDHKEIDDWTALHNAARGGNVEGCKLLCDAGANVVSLDNRKCTPLYISVFSDNVETVDYLTKASLEKDENVLRLRTVSDKTVLRKSAALGKTEFVKLLLKKYRDHLDVDAADETLLWTPLHIAAYKGLTDIVELLLEHGADPKCKDKRGNTALVLCYQQWELLHSTDATRDASFENCLVELIEADREAAVGQTHLLSAAARKGSIAVLEALVLSRPGEPRADPVLRDEFGWTAIELAKQFKRQLAVDFLQQHSGFTGRFPDAWKITKPKLSRFDADVRELHFIGDYSDDDGWESRVTVFSDVPIPANLERYYYEVKVEFPDPAKAIEGKHTIGVGVFAAQASKYSGGGLEECFPGHSATAKRGTQSWAYHGDDGWVGSSLYGYHDEHQLRSELFGHGDVVGCAIDFRKGHVFWTKNGKRLSKNLAFPSLIVPTDHISSGESFRRCLSSTDACYRAAPACEGDHYFYQALRVETRRYARL